MSSTPCPFACSRRASIRSTISSRLAPSLLGPIWAAATVTLRAMNRSPLGDAQFGDFFADESLDLSLEGHEGGARSVARVRHGHVHDFLDGAGACRHDHDFLVLLPDPKKLLLHHFAGLGVEGSEGLVHEENERMIREHAGNGHALLHPA